MIIDGTYLDDIVEFLNSRWRLGIVIVAVDVTVE